MVKLHIQGSSEGSHQPMAVLRGVGIMGCGHIERKDQDTDR